MSSLPPQDPYGQQGGPGGPPPPYGAPPPAYGGPPPAYGAPPPDYSATPAYQSASSGQAWAGPPLAEWPQRAIGGLIDYAGPWVVVFFVNIFLRAALGAVGFLLSVLVSFGLLAYLLWLGHMTGVTGQTPGKKIAKVRVLREADGQPLGSGQGILRQLCHFVDAVICYVGFLFPLWDPKKQTLADKIVKSVVITEAA